MKLTRPVAAVAAALVSLSVVAQTIGIGSGVVAMRPSLFFRVNSYSLGAVNPGFSTSRIKTSAVATGPSSGGDFRIVCGTWKVDFSDPMVYPYQPGSSHAHVFFGNTAITGAMGPKELNNLRAIGAVRSTCAGGTENGSGYWTPPVVDHVSGQIILPSINLVYYKNGSTWRAANPTAVQAPPTGLRFIHGNPGNTTEGGVTSGMKWACFTPNPTPGLPRVQQPFTLGIPPASTCPVGSELIQLLSMPTCWDGVHLDSPDHKSHMAVENDVTGCPITHPVVLPQFSFNLHYFVKAGQSTDRWRLASDNYTLASPGGYSAHGDIVFAWNPPTIELIVQKCLREQRDCHANLLGDGRTLY